MQLDQLVLKSFTRAEAVTPNDGADLPNFAYGFYIGVAGDLKVTTIGGDTVTFNEVPVGILDVAAKRVFSTGTAAQQIIALFYKS